MFLAVRVFFFKFVWLYGITCKTLHMCDMGDLTPNGKRKASCILSQEVRFSLGGWFSFCSWLPNKENPVHSGLLGALRISSLSSGHFFQRPDSHRED